MPWNQWLQALLVAHEVRSHEKFALMQTIAAVAPVKPAKSVLWWLVLLNSDSSRRRADVLSFLAHRLLRLLTQFALTGDWALHVRPELPSGMLLLLYHQINSLLRIVKIELVVLLLAVSIRWVWHWLPCHELLGVVRAAEDFFLQL